MAVGLYRDWMHTHHGPHDSLGDLPVGNRDAATEVVDAGREPRLPGPHEDPCHVVDVDMDVWGKQWPRGVSSLAATVRLPPTRGGNLELPLRQAGRKLAGCLWLVTALCSAGLAQGDERADKATEGSADQPQVAELPKMSHQKLFAAYAAAEMDGFASRHRKMLTKDQVLTEIIRREKTMRAAG